MAPWHGRSELNLKRFSQSVTGTHLPVCTKPILTIYRYIYFVCTIVSWRGYYITGLSQGLGDLGVASKVGKIPFAKWLFVSLIIRSLITTARKPVDPLR